MGSWEDTNGVWRMIRAGEAGDGWETSASGTSVVIIIALGRPDKVICMTELAGGERRWSRGRGQIGSKSA